jgi:hypothetical protein
MLEPYAVKVASTVLRRGGGSNLSSLFDYAVFMLIDRSCLGKINVNVEYK